MSECGRGLLAARCYGRNHGDVFVHGCSDDVTPARLAECQRLWGGLLRIEVRGEGDIFPWDAVSTSVNIETQVYCDLPRILGSGLGLASNARFLKATYFVFAF